MKANKNIFKRWWAWHKGRVAPWFAKHVQPWWHRFQITRWLVVLLLAIFLTISALGTLEAKTTDVRDLMSQLKTPTTVYDSDGNKAGSIAGQKGDYINYNKISPNVVSALLATEDRNFYHEPGFSVKGMTRGLLTTIWYRIRGVNAAAGGSTITQQLVKNAFLTQNQSITRKVRELFLAIQVEKVYSKNDILTMYLNSAYFGEDVWGIQDAAQKYFGVNAADLTVNQAAMLVGMLQSPNGYNPFNNPSGTLARRNQVITNMVNDKKLAANQANAFKATELGAEKHDISNNGYKYPYYFDAVLEEATAKYGISQTDLLNNGYRIYTTLNQKDQSNVQTAFADSALNPIGENSQAASVVLDARTGGVRAVVGGRGEHVFLGLNRATQSYRQPGSTIKPIVDYAPSLSRGFSYDSMLKNEPMTFGTDNYAPTNASNYVSGPVPMYKAIEYSYNIPAVWILDQIGVQAGYDAGIKAGLPLTKKDKNLSMAIGGLTKGVTPLQLAQAYTSFANGGVMSNAHFITKIVDSSGKEVASYQPKQTRLWSNKVANEMTQMMLGVYTYGTGASAKPAGYTVAGKTGTTEVAADENTAAATDSWAVAYTPDIVDVTWGGLDNTSGSDYISPYLAKTVGPLMKAELTDILPNTAQTKFGVQSVETTLANQALGTNSANGTSSSTSSGSTNDLMQNFKSAVTSTWDNITKGANNIVQGIFGN
ncbi:penicillin-binding protein 2a [Weissella oryzae SG25]|uniref:Penicillin-binding protein 2a n=1 Tax=Weissella oryzae (strain DSM 25784 / JCM 18191 / LMG 30913 / SG25) TaxID=1329250 RepID=A0A069CTC6_WEIOS|nr:PBP1A family penicillin-binding protein [Weissella oryzae]GAK30498.1 penicillin-binding protein 2a [Weissella oryzae SG25]